MPFRNKDVCKVEAKTPHCFMLYYLYCWILKVLIASTYFYLLLCKQCLFLGKKLFVPYIHIIRIQTNICRQIRAGNVSYLRNLKAQMPNGLKVLICKSKIVITLKYTPPCFYVRQRELYLSIYTSKAQQRRIKSFNTGCFKNNLHVSSCIKTIQLIQQLQHGSLNFMLAT